jgi:hypothetical protein
MDSETMDGHGQQPSAASDSNGKMEHEHAATVQDLVCTFCSRKLRKNGDCDDGSHNWYPFEKRTKEKEPVASRGQ